MPAKPSNPTSSTAIAKRWGKPLTDAGWTAVPNTILEYQRKLELNAIDVNILLHLWQRWWEPKNLPHPSMSTIADAMGVNRSTVQRHIREMEKRGILKRHFRKTSKNNNLNNQYDFKGLKKRAIPLAHKLIDRKKEKAETAKSK